MKHFKLLLSNTVVFFLLLLFFECFLRLFGGKPYNPNEKEDILLKNNSSYFQADSLLGYKHRPGHFEVQLKQKYNFSASHNKHSLRNTSYQTEADSIKKEEIWIFGCSLTYGWSLDDEDTFPWKLQEKLKNYKVLNWGVNGYGTLHFYLQLKEGLKTNRKPKLLILNHADFHHERNINSYNYNRSIAQWNNIETIKRPYLNYNDLQEMKVQYVKNEYFPWSLSTKYVLAKHFQFNLERFLDGRKFKKSLKITSALLDKIHTLCLQNNIQLILTNIDLKKDFIQTYTSKKNLPFIDISVDYTMPEYNNLPYDKHPSAKANEVYANKIYNFITYDSTILKSFK